MDDATSRTRPLTILIAACSVGAAAVHFAMVPAHGADSALLGVAFALTAWFQLLWAGVVIWRPTPPVLLAGAITNALVLAAWAASRTVGLPVGAHAGEADAVAAVDLLTVVFEVVVVAGSLVARRTSPAVAHGRWALTAAVPAIAVVFLTSAVLASPAAEHGHDDVGHAHDDVAHGHGEASGHDHAEDADIAHFGDQGHDHGIECTEIAPEEQQAADDLLAATLERVAEYDDLDAALADGYRPITPEAARMVHYGRSDYMDDGKVLDPSAPESLMYATPIGGDEPVLVGAMYLNDDPGTAPPSPAGCIVQWHDHTNLCIAPGRGMVGVVSPEGRCPAGSSNQVTSQMTHVWTIDLEGGPFAHEAGAREVLQVLAAS